MKSQCNMKACMISVIAVFAFLFGYDWLVHGMLLKADYEATQHLWRSEEEMQALGHWCIIYHLALAAVLTCLFKKVYAGVKACCPEAGGSCCPVKSGGLCFGVKVGLLMGIMSASIYMWLPIPGELAIKWFVAALVQGIGVGILLGMLYGKLSGGSCSVNTSDTTPKEGK